MYRIVPQPGMPGKNIDSTTQYGYGEGTSLPSPGFLRAVGFDNSLSMYYVYVSENATVIANAYPIPGEN